MIPIIIGPDGLGRPDINPFNELWDDAQNGLPVISATGEAVTGLGSYDCEVVWGIYDKDDELEPWYIWESPLRPSNEFIDRFKFQKLYRILPQPKEAVKEETVEEAAESAMMAASLHYDGENDYIDGFLACANWQKSTHIKKSKVVELVENNIKKIAHLSLTDDKKRIIEISLTNLLTELNNL